LRVLHDDATLYRLEKMSRIDTEPLVQQHLRVCWENRAVAGNCSQCDKCVRTMIVLHLRGQLEKFSVFDRQTPLPKILDQMEPVSATVHRLYQELLNQGLPGEIESSVHRLLRRDRAPRITRLRRKFRQAELVLARIRG
jgi:hypothetical protein